MTSPSFRFHGAIYKWQRTGGSWQLSRWGRVVAEVLPDERYPSMFRVKLPDRSFSDIVNLTRAKDAALRLVDHALQTRPQSAVERPPMRSGEGGATTLAADVGRTGKRKIGGRG